MKKYDCMFFYYSIKVVVPSIRVVVWALKRGA